MGQMKYKANKIIVQIEKDGEFVDLSNASTENEPDNLTRLQNILYRLEEMEYALVAGNLDNESITPGELQKWLDYVKGESEN